MPRPPKSMPEKMAVTRIENAFWKLLETEEYSDITVLRISQEAGINRNSFYYHYNSIDDLAYKAFVNDGFYEMAHRILNAMFDALQNMRDEADIVIDLSTILYFKGLTIYAGSDSYYLNKMATDLLKEAWFDYIAIREDSLATAEQLQVRFIFSGLTDILGSEVVKNNPSSLLSFFKTETWKSVIAELKRIALRKKV